MRLFYILILSFISIYPNLAHSIVKLKNVSQSGYGTDGTIKLELNGKYNPSNVKTTYKSDHLELLLPDAFVIPVRRVFKPSSSKSSVSKMEAVQVPGNAVKVSVYFRIPIDVIKKTGKLKGSGKDLVYSYSTVSKITALPSKTNLISEKESLKSPKPIEERTEITKITAEEFKVAEGDDFMWRFLRIISLVGLILLSLFITFYIYRRYLTPSKRVAKSMTAQNPYIKIISSFNLVPGKTLYIIDVLGERLLIAATRDNVTMLSRIGEEQDSESIMKSRLKEKLGNM